MPEPINPPHQTNPEAAGNMTDPRTANPQGQGYTAQTTVSSMKELKEKAPKVYNAMLRGIAVQITSQMKRNSDRLRKLMREGRDN